MSPKKNAKLKDSEIVDIITLRQHRERLAKAGAEAYLQDIERCYGSVVPHLKKAGYKKVTPKRCGDLIKDFVDMIFLAQGQRPFFHIEGELPFCWNTRRDKGWSLSYIRYEWGHLNSINQNIDSAHNIENLCLQSGRCNQHIQSALNADELISYGGELEKIINKNLKSRKLLFASAKWASLLEKLDKFKD